MTENSAEAQTQSTQTQPSDHEWSTEAIAVAGGFWTAMPLGGKTTVTFNRPWVIHPRTRKGLDELTEAGLLICEPLNHYPNCPLTWRPTDRLWSEGPKPSLKWLKANAFPVKDESQPEPTRRKTADHRHEET